MSTTLAPGRVPVRARIGDVAVIVVCAVSGVAVSWWWWDTSADPSSGWRIVDQALGVIGAVSLWWRRRHPRLIATLLVAAGTVSISLAVTPLVALFAVAVHRRRRDVMIIAATSVVGAVIHLRIFYADSPAVALFWALQVVSVAAAVAAGWVVRSRRELIESLRERARSAEVEAGLRAERAHLAEREALAREMHDALGHRLSLLSVNAGALGYNRDATPEETARAIEAIRANAHGALQDLREVIGVLRAPDGDAPLPGVVDLVELIDDARTAGAEVVLADGAGVTTGSPGLPMTSGRTVYRFVQETLTNARKHAPGSAVTVRLDGASGGRLTAEVINSAPGVPTSVDQASGGGSGLSGLRERAALVGGCLDHGPTADGGWRVALWLPWPS